MADKLNLTPPFRQENEVRQELVAQLKEGYIVVVRTARFSEDNGKNRADESSRATAPG